MKSINFKEIFENYNLNLLNKLRGFGEDKDYDFLKFWVPEENKFKSLINLLIVISEQKITNIQFLIDKNFIKEDAVFFNELLTKKIDSLELISNRENFVLKSEIISDKDIKILQKIFLENREELDFNPNFEKKNNQINKNLISKIKLISVENSKDFIPFHLDSSFCVKNIDDISSDTNQIRIEEKIDDFRFLFLINKNDLIIDTCYYEKANSSKLEKYINLFFTKIKGESIIEAREHGVLKIEDDIFKKEGCSGIRISQFIYSEISFIKNMIQKIYSKLGVEKNTNINKIYRKISDDWKKRNENEKKDMIANEIKNFMKSINISFDFILRNIEDHHRVYLNIDMKEKNESLKSSIFFELEKVLKKKIEFTIEIFNIEKIDENKLRLKNSPQAQ